MLFSMVGFDQKNPHHNMYLDDHCDFVYSMFSGREHYHNGFLMGAYLHDIGKLYTLKMATGIAKKCNSGIAYIGTEGSRNKYYANEFSYDLLELEEPFECEKYMEAIDAAVDAGYKVLIIDSMTHEWKWLNDIHDKMPGNSFTNWGKLKPRHHKFIDKVLNSPIHIIATARGKDDWVLEDKNGKQVPKKVGMGQQQDKDISYEYTVSLMIEQDTHVASSDKDNTHLFGLKNIEIIKDACELAGIPYPKSHTLNWLDEKVWNHIADSPVGIFQFESKFAYDSMKKFKCKCVNDLSLVNASIRPSGESYRDRLLSHEKNKNPSELIDDLLKENHGYLTFQEDTIKFLTNICGLSGSEADNIRRAIGRKQRDRLETALPDILNGYCKMSSKPREVAEKEAKTFLQIIEDSSNYQFGYNHSTGYSMIGYTCAYLRYYYPNEFITAYLNNANNEDDIITGTELAKQFGIKIHGIKFRHSIGKYSCDSNGIYKGISSVKYLNDEAANNLYSIKDKRFNTFIDLLVEISHLKIDSRKLEILIKLDFFEEFGGVKYLLLCNDIFTKYYGKKQMRKDKALEYGLDFELLRSCSEKETQKTFIGLNSVKLINELSSSIPNIKTDLKTKIIYQMENLGYVDVVDKKYAGYCVAVDLNVDYSPRLKLYALANGNTIPVKISKKIFAKNPIKRGDIVKVEDQCKKAKMKKIDGKWIETAEKEWWISEYKICNNIDL